MRPYLLILPCLCAATAMGQSPVERYEVGRRTHEFEVVWDAKIDNTAAAIAYQNQAAIPTSLF